MICHCLACLNHLNYLVYLQLFECTTVGDELTCLSLQLLDPVVSDS